MNYSHCDICGVPWYQHGTACSYHRTLWCTPHEGWGTLYKVSVGDNSEHPLRRFSTEELEAEISKRRGYPWEP